MRIFKRLKDLLGGPEAGRACVSMDPTTLDVGVSNAGVDPPTATLRMAARFPWLLPRSAEAADVAEWLTEMRLREVASGRAPTEVPSDPDALAEFLADLLAEIGAITGWDAKVAAPLVDLDAPATEPEPEPAPIAPRIAPPSPYRIAAVRFLSWVREEGRCGIYSAERMAALYREHAMAIASPAVSIDHMKAELRQLPGVSTQMAEKSDRGNRKARRARGIEWHLAEVETAASEDAEAIPFDLPYRSDTRWEGQRLAA